MSEPPTAVVGAGIIGLATAFHLVDVGAPVLVIDRDPDDEKASYGNAGGIAVAEVIPASSPTIMRHILPWILDPLGPVAFRASHLPVLIPWLLRFVRSGRPAEVERISRALRALNARAHQDLIPLLAAIGLAGELHTVGALSLYETAAGYARDQREWDCKRALGILAQDLTAADARALEPALGPLVHRAVFTPEWSHVGDPRLIALRLREWLLERGVRFHVGEVQDIKSTSTQTLVLRLRGQSEILANRVVIAAGAWSARLARCLHDPVLLESERGYTTTLPVPGIAVGRELIFAERKFVATPLRCGLRLGGTAEFGGLGARPNFARARARVDLAKRYLPDLNAGAPRVWAGHRPATPDSLPVIGPASRHPNVVYAFGHGHLGLTQAATTGRLVAEILLARPPSIDLTPYRIQRFNWFGGRRHAAPHLQLH